MRKWPRNVIAPCIAAWLGTAGALAQVGIVRTVEGQVNVHSGKQECAPRYGLDLEEGDAVRTGAKSWALLAMMDGTKITVRPDSEVRIDVYRYNEAGEPAQNRAQLALPRGAVRVVSGRIALGRRGLFVVKTVDAGMMLQGADLDVTYYAPAGAAAAHVTAGTYGRSYSGAALLSSAGVEVLLRDGQIAHAQAHTPPRVLSSPPYFYHWHDYIDRRAAAVAEKLDMVVP